MTAAQKGLGVGPKAWSPSLVASIRECVARPANLERIEKPGDEMYREWAYRFGSICTRRPKRAATCCACGKTIDRGTPAYHVTYTETPQGPWAPWQRFFHIDGSAVVQCVCAAYGQAGIMDSCAGHPESTVCVLGVACGSAFYPGGCP